MILKIAKCCARPIIEQKAIGSVKELQLKKKIEERCRRMYDKLSTFTHSRGIDKYRLQEGRDNVPRYLERSFNLWFKLFKETSKINEDLLKVFFIET